MSEENFNKLAPIKKQTRVESRLIEASSEMRSHAVVSPSYNHTAFCQTSFPYRNPHDTRTITKRNGSLTISITAGRGVTPKGEHVLLGLPFGPRARLVLIYLMTQAVVKRSLRIELNDSLTAFARTLGLSTQGRNIRSLRDQIQRMSACSIDLSIIGKGNIPTEHTQSHIIRRLQLFTPKEPGQRVLWPSYVELDVEFYESLLSHAVPLDPRALAALKHSSSALDCYQWLAQRLHRVSDKTVISWKSLHSQLGGATQRVASWKHKFAGKDSKQRGTLMQVLSVYPAAQDAVKVLDEGLQLGQAAPPIWRCQ